MGMSLLIQAHHHGSQPKVRARYDDDHYHHNHYHHQHHHHHHNMNKIIILITMARSQKYEPCMAHVSHAAGEFVRLECINVYSCITHCASIRFKHTLLFQFSREKKSCLRGEEEFLVVQ